MQRVVLLVFSYVKVLRGIFGQIVTDRPCCKMSAIHCKGAHIWQVSVYIFLHLQVGVKSATPADIIRKTLQEWKKHLRVIVVLTFLIFNWGGEASMYLCRSLLKTQKPDEKFFQTPPTLQNQLRFPTSTYLQKEHVIVRKDRRVPCERWSVRNLNHIHICRKKASCSKRNAKRQIVIFRRSAWLSVKNAYWRTTRKITF